MNDINTTLRPIKSNNISINASLEAEFPVIESYCVLENEKSNVEKKDISNNDDIEDSGVKELHKKVEQILNEF